MPRQQEYDSPAAKQAAYRERKREHEERDLLALARDRLQEEAVALGKALAADTTRTILAGVKDPSPGLLERERGREARAVAYQRWHLKEFGRLARP